MNFNHYRVMACALAAVFSLNVYAQPAGADDAPSRGLIGPR